MDRLKALKEALPAVTDAAAREGLIREIEKLEAEKRQSVSGPVRFIITRDSIASITGRKAGEADGETIQVSNGFESFGGTIVQTIEIAQAWRVAVKGREVIAHHPDKAWD